MASIGPHVNRYHSEKKDATIIDHINTAVNSAKIEADFIVKSASIFVGGPRDRVIRISEDEIRELRDSRLRIVAHSSYTAHPWKGDPDAARYIREELMVCKKANIEGLVIHLPKLPLESVIKYAPRLIIPLSPIIFLEVPAVQNSFYDTPEKIIDLFRELRDRVNGNFGLCIDTAHLWISGIDMKSYNSADEWIKKIENHSDILPRNKIMIHLNDSEQELGVGKDIHAPLGKGKIWGDVNPCASGIAAFIDYANRNKMIIILERKPKEMLINDYIILRDLISCSENII